MMNLEIPDNELWLLAGDFNFYRSEENRNREGGNLQDMCTFNNFINSHGLVEIPILGRAFTWSNMQQSPLLEQVDWIFSSALWTSTFPNTEIKPLTRNTSDHVPLLISIGTDIPKAKKIPL
jgi:endonuclease/exonuclease/phosphatase family metal-dependent hydrolase